MASAQELTFGPLLKRFRIAARLTQEALAERAGVSARGISDMERGLRHAPYQDTISRLAQALELTADERAQFEAASHHRRAPRVQHIPGVLAKRSVPLSRMSGLPIGAFLGATPASPLVGREADLGSIAVALEAADSGQGQLLILAGDPGVGKTRLAQEITVRARARGFSILTGRCYEPQQKVAYFPFLEALALAAGVGGETYSALSAQWPEVARLLPDLPANTQMPPQIDDRTAQQRLFWQVTGFLRTLADRAPLALLLDDLHWADNATLDLLQHLARHTRDRRILLVATYRDVEVHRSLAAALHDLSRDELVERIAVQPLAIEETTALIGSALGAGEGAQAGAVSVSPELAHFIYQRSEGNALFTRQLARALQEQGALQFEEGEWRLSARDPLPTPESIRAVIGQRLSHLTSPTQEALREASILGQDFCFADLERMSNRGEQAIEDALEEAARAGIVREGAHERYHFNHALILDTLYSDLSTRSKRRLHRAAADAIEHASEQQRQRRVAELAYHLLAADEDARALPYVLLAGDQAEAIFAHNEAESHYRAAAQLASELGDQELEAQAREKLGMVLTLQGRHKEAIELLERALLNYHALGNEQAELHSLAALLEIQGLYGREMVDEATARAQAVLARLEPPDPSVLTPALASGLAAVYRGLSAIYLGSGDREEQLSTATHAAELARIAGDDAQLAWALHRLYASGLALEDLAVRQEILAIAERSGQSIIVVWSHNRIGHLFAEEGDFALGMAHMQQSVALAEQRQDLVHLAWQLSNFTEFLFSAGDWRRMRETYVRAEAIMQEADPDRVTWQATAMSYWPGKLALLEGHEEEGRRLLEQALERMRRVGIARHFEYETFLLAEADLLAGAVEVAQQRCTTFRQASKQLAREEALSASILLAWAEGALGEWDKAGDRLASALAAAKPLYRVDAMRIQVLLATMQGHWDVATAALDETLDRIRTMPYPYAEAKTLWAYGRLEVARGDRAAARERFVQALTICDQLGEGLYRKYIERDLAGLEAIRDSTVPQ